MYVYIYGAITKTRKPWFWGRSGRSRGSKRKWKKDVIIKTKTKKGNMPLIPLGDRGRQISFELEAHLSTQPGQCRDPVSKNKNHKNNLHQTNHTHMFPRLVRWFMGKGSCFQTWRTEFNTQNPHGTGELAPLISPCKPFVTCAGKVQVRRALSPKGHCPTSSLAVNPIKDAAFSHNSIAVTLFDKYLFRPYVPGTSENCINEINGHLLF